MVSPLQPETDTFQWRVAECAGGTRGASVGESAGKIVALLVDASSGDKACSSRRRPRMGKNDSRV